MSYGDHLFVNYLPADIAFTHGKGAVLTSTDGRSILDFIAGIATCSLGHAHPRLVKALSEQAGRYLHVSNLYQIPEQDRASRALIEAAQSHLSETEKASGVGLERAFFCNSGAEANEAAIKLARKTAWRRHAKDGDSKGISDGEIPRFEILATHNGFHGRTMGALAATGTPRYHEGFGPLPAGFEFVPFNDLGAARAAMNASMCGVLVEPVQGEGGVNPASVEYLQGLQALCRDNGALFMVDEVQTAPARLGDTVFAFQKYGLEPDVVILAKGIGGGVPVGVVLARDTVARNLMPGDHGSTFGGNALASTAVQTVLAVVEEEGLAARATVAGDRLAAGIEGLASPNIVGQRGSGLMRAVELDIEAAPVAAECLKRGLLVNAVRPTSIRLLPPLVVSDEEIDQAVEIFGQAVAAAAAAKAARVAKESKTESARA